MSANFYASGNEVSGGIMFSGRPSVRPSVRPSRFVFVNISRTVRWFYIKLGMRVYPGGTILCVDFRVTGSKVKGQRSQIIFLFCRYLKNREVDLHQTWYEGISWGMILCLDFKVTGSKVRGHSLFCEKKSFVTVFYIL